MQEKEAILGMKLDSRMIVLEKGRLTLFFDEIGFKGNWLITALGPTVGAGLATLVVRDTKEDVRIIDVRSWIDDDDSLSGVFGY